MLSESAMSTYTIGADAKVPSKLDTPYESKPHRLAYHFPDLACHNLGVYGIPYLQTHQEITPILLFTHTFIII